MVDQKHKVLIVGGGYAGVRAARLLAQNKRYETTLVSNSLYFRRYAQFLQPRKTRFQPQLKLETIFGHKRLDIDLVRAKITKFQPDDNKVLSDKGIEYHYDSLVLALGRTGRPHNWQHEQVYSAYSFEELVGLKRSMEADFESGVGVRYVVVGGGETGVEMAAELRIFANDLARQYDRHHSLAHIVVLERKPRILPDEAVPPEFRKKVLSRLKDLNVMVLTNSSAGVHSLSKLRNVNGAGTYDKQVVVQANGSIVNPFFIIHRDQFALAQNTLVRTSSLCEADGYNNVYIIGDCADTEQSGTVATALYDANFLASVLDHKADGKNHQHYEPPKKVFTLELGKRWAVTQNRRHVRRAKLGWMLKRWIDLKHFSTLVPKRVFIKRMAKRTNQNN